MKSERRHELQHNDLAEWAVRSYESVLPYRLSILGVILLLVVGVVAWEIWHGHTESQAVEAWNAVEPAQAVFAPIYNSPQMAQQYAGMMQKASETYSGSPAADWAQMLTADSCLYLGQSLLMGNKEAATNFLNNAGGLYEKTLAASAGPLASERAMFGKARILESVGKLPEATAAYQELIKEFPQGAYKAVADQRIEQLGKPETAEFYKAVAEYKPKSKVEKSAAGPSGKAENLTPPENPDMPPIAAPVKPSDSSSSTAASAPKSSGTGTAPKAEVPKAELPKSTAALPALAAPVSSATPPAKKDK